MGVKEARRGGPAAVSHSTVMLLRRPIHSCASISCRPQSDKLSAVLQARAGMPFLACQLDTVISQQITMPEALRHRTQCLQPPIAHPCMLFQAHSGLTFDQSTLTILPHIFILAPLHER